MSTFVPLLDSEQAERLPARAREVIEYRKSGLSLNHIQGCPLECAYCIRHTYGLWDQRQPRALMLPPVPVSASADAESGRGLLLVNAISNRWNWYVPPQDGGKVVWALLEIP